MSDLLGHRASNSSKKIMQGAEFCALWNTCLTARSLSPTYCKLVAMETHVGVKHVQSHLITDSNESTLREVYMSIFSFLY